jgi:alpha-glucosidase
VHDVFRRWRSIAESYAHEPILVGETWVADLKELMRFYGSGSDELHLALNVPFVFAELGDEMRAIVEQEEAVIPAGAWPTWTGSNHDAARFPTRWCHGEDRKIRAALAMLLTLRGTPILYYGDEIGMTDVGVPLDRLRDPVGLRGWPVDPGRDRARTPMPWTDEPHVGFTLPDVEPWLPVGDRSRNVAGQYGDPGSILNLTRDLLSLRRGRPDIREGSYATVEASDGAWVWRRGDHTLVAMNHSDGVLEVGVGDGTVLVSTQPGRAGQRIGPRVRLDPWEVLVMAQQTEA